jgi:lysophospholipase L1-like esterase
MNNRSSLLVVVASIAACSASFVFAAEEQRPMETVPPPPAPALDPALPTIFIAGDSTAAHGNPDAIGWGRPFASYFDVAKVNIANRARGGRSSRTFQTEGLWDKLLAEVKAGDLVLIQFGHNDAGAINEEPPGSNRPVRARGTIPGLGDDAIEIDNVLTKQHEVVRTFGWYMRKCIADVRAKGATPVLLSLTVRNMWTDGRVERGSGQYGEWTAALGRTEGVAFIDLTGMIADEYEKLGQEKVAAFFPKDHTHTGADGAELNASLVVAGLKRLHDEKIAAWVSDKGRAIAPAPALAVSAAPSRPPGAAAGEAEFRRWLNLPEPANPALPTLWLIGDSTVRNGRGDGGGGQWGWGDPIAACFDAAKINVVNRAVGGMSSRTFYTGRHWARVLEALKPGDFVVMQFGHNDGAPLNDQQRARGTIKGNGDESEEVDNLITKQHEVVHSYGWYLRQFAAEARAKGATPIICSLVPRKTWVEGKMARAIDNYGGWARAAAEQTRVPFVDLNEIIARRYDELGPEKVEPLFADPHTHTTRAGAELNAECVIAGLKGLTANPLAPFFSAKCESIAPAP